MVQAAAQAPTTAVSWLAPKGDVTDRALHLGIDRLSTALIAAPQLRIRAWTSFQSEFLVRFQGLSDVGSRI